jgi:N5-hydroxyornithine acetyltransferase
MPALPNTGNTPSIATLPTLANFMDRSSDTDLLNKWMNNARVNAAWGLAGPRMTQMRFLEDALSSRHSFPVFGCWDGKPFGYFEIYWVKEDKLGRLLGGDVGNYTRGIHALVGEQEFRGPHRVPVWLSSLVHYCWLADSRTEQVMLEPRVDSTK